MTKDCHNEDIHSRGVCANCYQAYWHKIQQGKATWKKLEAKGLVLAPYAPQTVRSKAARAMAAAGMLNGK